MIASRILFLYHTICKKKAGVLPIGNTPACFTLSVRSRPLSVILLGAVARIVLGTVLAAILRIVLIVVTGAVLTVILAIVARIVLVVILIVFGIVLHLVVGHDSTS